MLMFLSPPAWDHDGLARVRADRDAPHTARRRGMILWRYLLGRIRSDSMPHPFVRLQRQGKTVLIDVGVVDDVQRLWRAGVDTWVSCQGDRCHSRYVGIVNPAQADVARALLPWVRREMPGFCGDYVLYGRTPLHSPRRRLGRSRLWLEDQTYLYRRAVSWIRARLRPEEP